MMFQQPNTNSMPIVQKHDYFFFVKKCDKRDEGSQAFLERVRGLNKYKNFTTKEELLIEVKRVLRKFIDTICYRLALFF